MGETGAGITSEDQINMSVSNAFTNKWGKYYTNTCVDPINYSSSRSLDPGILPVALENEGVD
jgi:hypothetical protein